jgi:hypothetical protein
LVSTDERRNLGRMLPPIENGDPGDETGED